MKYCQIISDYLYVFHQMITYKVTTSSFSLSTIAEFDRKLHFISYYKIRHVLYKPLGIVRFCNQCFCSSKVSLLTVFILTKKNQNSVFAMDHFTTEIVDHAEKISWITTRHYWNDLKRSTNFIVFAENLGNPRSHASYSTKQLKIGYLNHKAFG